MGFQFFSRKPKPEIYLILDIGTESIKALILEKKPAQILQGKIWAGEEEKICVLGSSLEYYDQFSVFLTPQFEREVIKMAVSKAITELKRQTGIKSKSVIMGLPSRATLTVPTSSGQNIAERVKVVLLGLPPNIFVSRVVFQSLKRKEKGVIKEKEKEEILKDVLEQGKKKISQIYAQEKGILPNDLQFLNLRILETKIDGYAVPDVLDYDGKNLDFRLLVSFLPKYYLETSFSGYFSPFPIVKELGFEISGITATAERLCPFLVQSPEAIFLDIGGEATQIFLAKNGLFEKISEFNKGGKDFSQVLSERLGLDESSARDLKHRYSRGDISEESRQTLRDFFETAAKAWFKDLKSELKKMDCGIFPSDILIFGGGALLPEVKEFLEEGEWENISFAEPPKVKLLKPKDFINIEEKIGLTSQNTPTLLIYYCIEN